DNARKYLESNPDVLAEIEEKIRDMSMELDLEDGFDNDVEDELAAGFDEEEDDGFNIKVLGLDGSDN
ncbi:MAG: hypothetical protein J6I45_03205, partial [Clostridia bacterium]|nr:hypothetical protein [Clostridia bacterium]